MTYPINPAGQPQPHEEYPFVEVDGYTQLVSGPTADNDNDLD